MPLIYEVIGYDKNSGEVSAEYKVPDRTVASVLRIAGVLPSHDGLGCYPLNDAQLSEISTVLERPIEKGNRDFFLEPSEVPQRASS